MAALASRMLFILPSAASTAWRLSLTAPTSGADPRVPDRRFPSENATLATLWRQTCYV
jgi:hypothetical protein